MTWRLVALLFAGLAAIVCAWLTSIHLSYRRQMEAVAMIERLGGSIRYDTDAPEWLQRLQPDEALEGLFGPQLVGLGPNWLRARLPVQTVVDELLRIDAVYLDNGPGMKSESNLSGEHRDVAEVDPTDDDLALIARLPHIQNLYLRDTRIGDEGVRHLRTLGGLTDLFLSFTQITDESLEVVAGFRNLKRLRLVGTGITDVGLARLVVLSELEELDVRATNVTSAALAPFLARPGLTVRHNAPDEPVLLHFY